MWNVRVLALTSSLSLSLFRFFICTPVSFDTVRFNDVRFQFLSVSPHKLEIFIPHAIAALWSARLFTVYNSAAVITHIFYSIFSSARLCSFIRSGPRAFRHIWAFYSLTPLTVCRWMIFFFQFSFWPCIFSVIASIECAQAPQQLLKSTKFSIETNFIVRVVKKNGSNLSISQRSWNATENAINSAQ